MFSASASVSERAARAALTAFVAPKDVAAGLAEHGPVLLWQRLARADRTGRLADYRPAERLEAAQRSARFVMPGDPDWPHGLDELGNTAPLGIWVRGPGDLASLTARAIAVTGNQHAATAAAKLRAALIAGDLAAAGHTVTASVTHGVDADAHTGAHMVPAPTIAVLPCGPDMCHPHGQDHILRAALREGGAIVSAHRPGTPASPTRLHTAARLTAALSTAVALIEPSPDSPAMDTADTAHLLDRPTRVLPPGDPSGPPATGTHRLLDTGRARPARDADDILIAVTLR